MKTQLIDRTLWYDGTCEVEPEKVPELFFMGAKPDHVAVSSMSEDIELFNSLSDVKIKSNKLKNEALNFDWKIPADYLSIDVADYCFKKLDSFFDVNPTLTIAERYVDRVVVELAEIEKRNLHRLFQALIYMVETLRGKDQLWGIGRGSSCASLVLFLIGLHVVDPIKFNISEKEFFHD